MNFARTYRTTCDKTRELRADIEYQIPADVRSRLELALYAGKHGLMRVPR